MDDLIKRRDAEHTLTILGAQLSEKHTSTVAKCICAIKDVPDVDAVPVVRCMQCKYYNRALLLCNNGLGARPFEFYCADGAKMDGGAEDEDS